MGQSNGIDGSDVEGQMVTLYIATMLLLCLTGVVVGGKAAHLLVVLLGALLIITVVITTLDLSALGSVLQVNTKMFDPLASIERRQIQFV